MGINIIVYRRENDRNIKVDWFDTARFSGDRDFVWNDAIEWHSLPHEPLLDDTILCRPKNIDLARNWVRQNIYKGNQPRLLELLDNMESDPDLWLYVSV
jgi:hypothetical protein